CLRCCDPAGDRGGNGPALLHWGVVYDARSVGSKRPRENLDGRGDATARRPAQADGPGDSRGHARSGRFLYGRYQREPRRVVGDQADAVMNRIWRWVVDALAGLLTAGEREVVL